MATLAKQTVDIDGTVLTLGAANGGGDDFVPDEDTFLVIANGSGSPITVTVETPKEAFPGAAIEDTAIVVAAGTTRHAGPFPANRYGDPDNDGKANITYSGVTSLTIAAAKLSR